MRNENLNCALQFAENLVTMAENGQLGEKNVKPAMLFLLSILTNVETEERPIWNRLRVVKAIKDETGANLHQSLAAANKIRIILGFPQN